MKHQDPEAIEGSQALDDLLRAAVAAPAPRFDAQAWRIRHAEALQALAAACSSPEAAPKQGQEPRFWGWGGGRIAAHRAMRYAAVIALLLLGGGLLFWWPIASTSLAMAEVLEQFQARRYRFELRIEEGAAPAMRGVGRVREPGQLRLEFEGGAGIIVIDRQAEASLVIWDTPALRGYSTHRDYAALAAGPLGLLVNQGHSISNLWQLTPGGEQFLGRRELAGEQVEGFRIERADPLRGWEQVDLWAEVVAAQPVQVVLRYFGDTKPTAAAEPVATMTLHHFRPLDRQDAALFSVEPPAGFPLIFSQALDQVSDQTMATDHVSSEAGKLLAAIERWRDQHSEEAIEQMRHIQWDRPLLFPADRRVYHLSEAQFASLLPSEASGVLQDEILPPLGVWRQLARAIAAQAAEARQRGDTADAARDLAVLIAWGQMLHEADRLLIVRMMGVSIERLGLREAIVLHTATDEQAKLETMRRRDAYLETVVLSALRAAAQPGPRPAAP